jgi:hypothetical protein
MRHCESVVSRSRSGSQMEKGLGLLLWIMMQSLMVWWIKTQVNFFSLAAFLGLLGCSGSTVALEITAYSDLRLG